MDRSFHVVVWLLAILKAGACYVVLEKSLPLARKRAILDVAEAELLVTDIVDEALMAGCTRPPKVLNIWAEAESPIGRPQASAEPEPTDLAYIVFTSGSTGMPKAIMVEHRNLSSYVSSAREAFKLAPGSRVLQLASFAFDESILEFAVTLSYGATLCFVNHPSLLVGESLVAFVAPATVQGSLIRQRMSQDLPPYSVPTVFTAVSKLPQRQRQGRPRAGARPALRPHRRARAEKARNGS